MPAVQPLAKAEEIRIPFQSAQAYVLIGQPGFKRSDPDFLALLVGNHILGGGGFTSRLTEEVREKRGLSYSVYSQFAPGLQCGRLRHQPADAPRPGGRGAESFARRCWSASLPDGPTEAELKAAKDNLIGGFALRIDSNRKLLGNVVNIATNDLPLDYLDGWTDRVAALTVADVRAAMARKLQPERMVTVVLGAQP
ncbi:MAG: insulinase family protein [Giesbergeria sp.]